MYLKEFNLSTFCVVSILMMPILSQFFLKLQRFKKAFHLLSLYRIDPLNNKRSIKMSMVRSIKYRIKLLSFTLTHRSKCAEF